MTLHQTGNDYVVTFDHHEDVQVMDSENAPSRIEGYQIKTKGDGAWTVKAVTKQEAGAQPSSLLPSILGKLFHLKLQFPEETGALQFVSNAPFRVKLKIGGKTQSKEHVLFDEIDDDVQVAVSASLQKELGLPAPPVLTALLQLSVTDVPLRGHETYVKGKLANFLEQLHPGRPFRIVPIYRALLSEVAVRNNNQEPVTEYDDLIRLKSISRTGFSELLAAAGASPTELKWDAIEARLNSEQAPLPVVQGLRREWDGVELDKISCADVVHLRLWEMVSEACANHRQVPRLTDAIEAVHSELALKINPSWPFSQMYLKAAIILGIYESK